MGMFVVPDLMGGARTVLVGNLIRNQFLVARDWPFGSAASMLLTALTLLVTLGFGAIGWVDDWRKVVRKDPEGMRSREKFLWQTLIGLIAAFVVAGSKTMNLIELAQFKRTVTK